MLSYLDLVITFATLNQITASAMNRLFILTLFVGVTLCAVAQELNPNPSVSSVNIQKIAEVYGNQFVEQNPTLVLFFNRLLTERISFEQVVLSAEEKYPVLSSFGLNNKVNSSISPIQSETFSPETFNPLTYLVGYSNKQPLVIRIDGTDFLMIVQPQ